MYDGIILIIAICIHYAHTTIANTNLFIDPKEYGILFNIIVARLKKQWINSISLTENIWVSI